MEEAEGAYRNLQEGNWTDEFAFVEAYLAEATLGRRSEVTVLKGRMRF